LSLSFPTLERKASGLDGGKGPTRIQCGNPRGRRWATDRAYGHVDYNVYRVSLYSSIYRVELVYIFVWNYQKIDFYIVKHVILFL
jgi:hypothetical protein